VKPCQAGCGAITSKSSVVCIACDEAWTNSREFARALEIAQVQPATYPVRGTVALMDFCTRVRLERMNGAKS
jgi:hypothetical protein